MIRGINALTNVVLFITNPLKWIQGGKVLSVDYKNDKSIYIHFNFQINNW
jgi:hypothetical protein